MTKNLLNRSQRIVPPKSQSVSERADNSNQKNKKSKNRLDAYQYVSN